MTGRVACAEAAESGGKEFLEVIDSGALFDLALAGFLLPPVESLSLSAASLTRSSMSLTHLFTAKK